MDSLLGVDGSLILSLWEGFLGLGGIENLYVLSGNFDYLVSCSPHKVAAELSLPYLFFFGLRRLREPMDMNINQPWLIENRLTPS